MSIMTIGIDHKREAPTSKRPFFEPIANTHSAKSSISHPQLRDLLICPTQAHHVQTVSGHGIDAHLFGQYTMRLMDTPTSFLPNCLVSGCGYVAMGGGAADLLIRSADIHSRWELKIITGQSIVNSVHFYQISQNSNPQLLVCNNDQTITQYDLSTVSSIQEAAADSLSADPAHRLTPQIGGLRPRERNYVQGDGDNSHRLSTSEEKPVFTHKSSIILPVPVNHCSVSPDLRSMVAVGDSNTVFLYDCRNAYNSNEPLISDWRLRSRNINLPGVSPSVGSFSTSWNQYGDKFAVASEGEVVVVYDIKMLDKPLLVKRTAQKGRPGGARVVKFSPAGPNELLAFTEHQSLVHVLDARTFDPDHEDILTVPTPFPGMTLFPPRLSPDSVRITQSNNGASGRSSHLEPSSLAEDEESTSGSSRRTNETSSTTSRNYRTLVIDANQQEEEEENRSRFQFREAGSFLEEENPRNRMVYPEDEDFTITEAPVEEALLWEFTRRQSPEPVLTDRMWRESIQNRSGEENPRPSSSTNRTSQVLGLGPRGSRVQRGYTWAARLGGLHDDEACLEAESDPSSSQAQSQQQRPLNPSSSSRSTSSGARMEWGTPSETSSSRPIQLHGSSIRVLSVDNGRRSEHRHLTIVPTTTTSSLIHHRGPTSSTISSIHANLINNRLGRNPPTFAQSEAWFDLESTAGGTATGSLRNHAASLHGLPLSTYSGVRSGMWDDLIGLSWSPDGDWLFSGTEVGLVEWKVKTSSRCGFGDSRLC